MWKMWKALALVEDIALLCGLIIKILRLQKIINSAKYRLWKQTSCELCDVVFEGMSFIEFKMIGLDQSYIGWIIFDLL